MAERRMFSSKVVCSDAFAEMPFSAQALYVQLNMEADDDGFLNRAKRIQGSIGASDADLNLLFEKRFILGFDNGVIAIKHWRMNNQIRKDRYTPTQYQGEFNSLEIREDGAYTEKGKSKEAVDNMATTCQPLGNQNGNQMATQYSIGKDSIGKGSLVEDNNTTKRKRFSPPTIEEVKAYCLERNNNVDAERFIDFYTSNGWQVGKNKMKDWKAAVRTWERNGYVDKQSTSTRSMPKSFDTNDFFNAALKRSYGEDYERLYGEGEKKNPKTAAEDEAVRAKAEDLKARLQGE